jgi:signal transduction histidine kinase
VPRAGEADQAGGDQGLAGARRLRDTLTAWTERTGIDQPVVLIAAVLAATILLVGSLVNVTEQVRIQRDGSEAVSRAIAVNVSLRRVELGIKDAESGQRGFLLTGDDAYLAPYLAAEGRLDEFLGELRRRWVDDGHAAADVDGLAEGISEKRAELARTVALARAGRHDQALSVVRTNSGQVLMDEITRRIETMRAGSNGRLSARIEEVALAQARTARILVAISMLTIAVFAFLVVGLLRVRRIEARRLRETRAMAALANRANAELERARDEALAATLAKSRFLAAASHDMRQPLHALSLFASALERRVSGEDATRLVSNIQHSTRSMQGMFSGLLDLSRIEAGALVPRPERVALGPILDAVRTEFGVIAADKGLRLDVVGSGLSLVTDPEMLAACLRNLVANAVKFTPTGRILVGVRHGGGVRRIEVHDTGPGIPADRLDRIFDEFERLGRTRRTGDDGLGLGLAIVRRTARLLGIAVKVRSTPGRGSCFVLELPDAGAATRGALPPRAPVAAAPLRGRRVLVVDDDRAAREALVGDLRDRGYDAVGAETAAEATGLAPSVDLVVMDLDLGSQQDGIALLERMDRIRGGRTPALILTGSTDADALNRVDRAGRPWMIKPAQPEALAARLARIAGQPSGG